ncbi:MAG: hypothetical protein N2039_07340 [Gemmataceae bacterium]|nr:hypothetical protein [Gemmataceae bacterium]
MPIPIPNTDAEANANADADAEADADADADADPDAEAHRGTSGCARVGQACHRMVSWGASVKDEACAALQQVIQQYGPGIHQVPRSCELLIQQACGTFPQESQVLIEALRDGVPGDLDQYRPEEESWEAVAEALAYRLSRRGMAADEGRWAVETWAKALSRHPENFAPHQPEPWNATSPATGQASGIGDTGGDSGNSGDSADRLLRLLIASGGGALGGFLGSAIYPTSILINEVAMRMPHVLSIKRAFSMRDVWTAAVFVWLLFALGGAVFGAIGAAVGWSRPRRKHHGYAVFLAGGAGAFVASLIGAFVAGIFGGSIGAFLGALGVSLAWARSAKSE